MQFVICDKRAIKSWLGKAQRQFGMRSLLCSFVAVSLLVPWANAAQAEVQKTRNAEPSTFSLETPEAVPAKPGKPLPIGWQAEHQLQVAILKEITARKRRTGDKGVSRRLDELGTLYAGEFQGPIWLDNDRANERARSALRELQKAAEWGLDAADYRFDVPHGRIIGTDALARFEIDFAMVVLKYVDHARSGRFRPTEMSLWYESASNKADHMELLRQLAVTSDPARLLTGQHPQHDGFKQLRNAYLKLKFPGRFQEDGTPAQEAAPQPVILSNGPRIRRGKRHPQIALLRERLNVPATDPNDETLYDRQLMNAVNRFMRTQGWRRKYVYDNKVRRALNADATGTSQRKTGKISLADIVTNMEKWRWLPRDLGDIHIWNNLPSFHTEVVKNGSVIHKERIIIGKTATQTPVFSDTMTHVVFKPQWGIPNSIKVKSLLPRLAAGDLDVLRRRGMRIQYGDKVMSPARYNWSKTDIRSIPIVMGPGSSNPLGRVKFMFPNHHAVYMHDTPDRHLFKNTTRTHSHGCIRVRDPIRFAEVVLGETTDWSTDLVAAHLKRRAKENNRVDLAKSVSVHNTYFTVVAGKNGKLKKLRDIYGHDKRIKQALAGKSLTVIARSDPARIHQEKVQAVLNNRNAYVARRQQQQPLENDFGFFQYGLGGPSPYTAAYAPAPKKSKKYKKKKKSAYHSWRINPYSPYGAFGGD